MKLTLYSKPDCLLCDDLKHDLTDLQRELGFSLEERNILEVPELGEKFGLFIPVLEMEDGRLLYPPHDWLTLHTTLSAALAGGRSTP